MTLHLAPGQRGRDERCTPCRCRFHDVGRPIRPYIGILGVLIGSIASFWPAA